MFKTQWQNDVSGTVPRLMPRMISIANAGVPPFGSVWYLISLPNLVHVWSVTELGA
jgi:hypothetical protein